MRGLMIFFSLLRLYVGYYLCSFTEKHPLADTWRNDNIIITSNRRRFDIIMTLSLRHVSAVTPIEYFPTTCFGGVYVIINHIDGLKFKIDIDIHRYNLFVSLLSHFWLIDFFLPIYVLWTISRPLSSSMCSITANVGGSYNRMRGPGIGCWFSDRSNCSPWSFTQTFTLTSVNLSLYTTVLLVLVLIQLCSPRCWHLDSNYCRTWCWQSQLRFVLSPLLLHPRLLGTFQSDIPLFTLTWPAKYSPNQGAESTHRLHLYPLGGVFYYP